MVAFGRINLGGHAITSGENISMQFHEDWHDNDHVLTYNHEEKFGMWLQTNGTYNLHYIICLAGGKCSEILVSNIV